MLDLQTRLSQLNACYTLCIVGRLVYLLVILSLLVILVVHFVHFVPVV